MVERWITKKNGEESRHIRIETNRKAREVRMKDIGVSAQDLEKQAWGILGDLSRITNVDQLMLQMKKYSGTLGDYSAFNAALIASQDGNATIVRSRNEWKYFGRELKEDATPIHVLYPIGVPRKDSPGKVKEFIEQKRKEGLDDETIDQLVREKFNIGKGNTGQTYVFGVGTVYDISQTSPVPGKEKPIEETVKASKLYGILKGIAREHYDVEEGQIATGARGYTAHSGEGQKIVVMRIPGEDENVLHTLIHEMSHARLEHLYRKDLPRGLAESEAELSTYLVGAHFGFDFREDSAAYIKGWLDDAKKSGKGLGKENLDRVMNNARWLINEIDHNL
jgi:hypothetical protein